MTRILKLEQQFGATKVFETMEGQTFPASVATFANHDDALAFIAAILPDTEQGMTAKFQLWMKAEGLTHVEGDAEEVFHWLSNEPASTATSVRGAWLLAFIRQWEMLAKSEAFWNAPVVDPYEATKREFPAYPAADLPEMPQGFEDASWHNDMSPSIENRAMGLRVWIDFLKPEDRDLPDSKRFTVQGIDADGDLLDEDDLLNTDEWADVLALIATRKEA